MAGVIKDVEYTRGPRTTADSKAEGRLKKNVAGDRVKKKRKRGILRHIVSGMKKDGAGGPGMKKRKSY